jgi:hypothetical protein
MTPNEQDIPENVPAMEQLPDRDALPDPGYPEMSERAAAPLVTYYPVTRPSSGSTSGPATQPVSRPEDGADADPYAAPRAPEDAPPLHGRSVPWSEVRAANATPASPLP